VRLRRQKTTLGSGAGRLSTKATNVFGSKEPDLFDAPYDLSYVQARIKALETQSRIQWSDTVELLRKCANPPRGMQVSADAIALAKAKLKELSARTRPRGSR
jgi:hypothetical protein